MSWSSSGQLNWAAQVSHWTRVAGMVTSVPLIVWVTVVVITWVRVISWQWGQKAFNLVSFVAVPPECGRGLPSPHGRLSHHKYHPRISLASPIYFKANQMLMRVAGRDRPRPAIVLQRNRLHDQPREMPSAAQGRSPPMVSMSFSLSARGVVADSADFCVQRLRLGLRPGHGATPEANASDPCPRHGVRARPKRMTSDLAARDAPALA